MSVESVRHYLNQWHKGQDILEFPVSSATVSLAATALGVEPARIAKSITFRKDDLCILVVVAGDGKIDNAKYKAQFGCKAKMLNAEEVPFFTGHAIGGVCPFALPDHHIEVYCDISLRRFTTVFPACGSSSSAIELTPDELALYGQSLSWVDVCKTIE